MVWEMGPLYAEMVDWSASCLDPKRGEHRASTRTSSEAYLWIELLHAEDPNKKKIGSLG